MSLYSMEAIVASAFGGGQFFRSNTIPRRRPGRKTATIYSFDLQT